MPFQRSYISDGLGISAADQRVGRLENSLQNLQQSGVTIERVNAQIDTRVGVFVEVVEVEGKEIDVVAKAEGSHVHLAEGSKVNNSKILTNADFQRVDDGRFNFGPPLDQETLFLTSLDQPRANLTNERPVIIADSGIAPSTWNERTTTGHNALKGVVDWHRGDANVMGPLRGQRNDPDNDDVLSVNDTVHEYQELATKADATEQLGLHTDLDLLNTGNTVYANAGDIVEPSTRSVHLAPGSSIIPAYALDEFGNEINRDPDDASSPVDPSLQLGEPITYPRAVVSGSLIATHKHVEKSIAKLGSIADNGSLEALGKIDLTEADDDSGDINISTATAASTLVNLADGSRLGLNLPVGTTPAQFEDTRIATWAYVWSKTYKPAFKACGAPIVVGTNPDFGISLPDANVLGTNCCFLSNSLTIPTDALNGSFEVNTGGSDAPPSYNNGLFTAPVAGIYSFYATVSYNASGNIVLDHALKTFFHIVASDATVLNENSTFITDDGSGISSDTGLLWKMTNFQQSSANGSVDPFSRFTENVSGTIELAENERVGLFMRHTNTGNDPAVRYMPSESYVGGHLITEMPA